MQLLVEHSSCIIELVVDAEIHKPQSGATTFSMVPNGNSFLEHKTVTLENGNMVETQDKNIIIEGGLGSVDVYNQWVAHTVSGSRPRPRYQHGAALLEDKMYIFGGNHNGFYLRDIQVLDLKSLAWSKVEANAVAESPEAAALVVPCAGHSLISWENKILSVAGYTKDPFEMVTVRTFDPQTCMWSNLKTYRKPPISRARGGQSVTLVGKTLVMFGDGDAKRNLLNYLHILDLETMTWDEFDAIWNGRNQSNKVYVLKPSHKSNLQSKMMEGSASDNIIAFLSTTNVSGGVEPESEAAPEGKIREIMMDGVDLESSNIRSEDASSQLVAAVKTEKEELEASVARQQMQNFQLQQEVSEAETRNIELTKELQSVRGQLAAEQSRCFKLEVDVAELRQKLQTMESLQKATSEQASFSARARQSSGGLWGWLAGAPEKSDSR